MATDMKLAKWNHIPIRYILLVSNLCIPSLRLFFFFASMLQWRHTGWFSADIFWNIVHNVVSYYFNYRPKSAKIRVVTLEGGFHEKCKKIIAL